MGTVEALVSFDEKGYRGIQQDCNRVCCRCSSTRDGRLLRWLSRHRDLNSSKLRITVAALAAATLLCGCGQPKPEWIERRVPTTDDERKAIAEHVEHILAAEFKAAGDAVGLQIATNEAHWFDPSGRVVPGRA